MYGDCTSPYITSPSITLGVTSSAYPNSLPFPYCAVRDIHSLVIRSVCHAHGGVYKSVISNNIGKATCYSHLYVTGNIC